MALSTSPTYLTLNPSPKNHPDNLSICPVAVVVVGDNSVFRSVPLLLLREVLLLVVVWLVWLAWLVLMVLMVLMVLLLLMLLLATTRRLDDLSVCPVAVVVVGDDSTRRPFGLSRLTGTHFIIDIQIFDY
jgi:hypothetical protein